MIVDISSKKWLCQCIALVLCIAFVVPFQAFADTRALAHIEAARNDSVASLPAPVPVRLPGDRVHVTLDDQGEAVVSDSISVADISAVAIDSIAAAHIDSIAVAMAQQQKLLADSLRQDSIDRATYGRVRVFEPDPTRAVWLSVLFPGAGQVYNRRYWKLPIIAGGYVGLIYATTWNNQMLQDYAQAYRDITDDDPNTHSYMDFYPSTVTEADLDMDWLERTLQSRRNYFRRYRDLCIILMVGLYALCIIDAYVDASLANFDVSPDLAMKVTPTLLDNGPGYRWPAFGASLSFNF